ncbi:MAG TPA: hypothetical protein VD763_02140 [Candidatus Saccharimonadales bacterium]|nr:hypothetical protein [Candidatus Saccharimonadales bacterium]
MHSLYPHLALELVRERQAAAAHAARIARFERLHPRPSAMRHALAVAFAAISRGSAVAVRRLDGCLADDLVDGLATGRGV